MLHRRGLRSHVFRRKVFVLLSFLILIFFVSGCSSIFTDTRTPDRLRARKAKKSSSQRKTKYKVAAADKGKFLWPVRGKITSKFGPRGRSHHDGLDIAAPGGTKILAAASGEVIFSGQGPSGYGKIVMIKHSSEYVTVYAHNSKNAVSKGKTVKRGAVIAYVGKTGRATGNHLHFEVRVNLVPRNPLLYLPRLK